MNHSVKFDWRMWMRRTFFAVAGLVAILGFGQGALAEQGAGWLHYGGDAGGSRHSVATAITPENVSDLRQAWVYRTGDMVSRAEDMKHTAFETTPILFEGSLIFCSPFNEVIALDPGTGEQKWRHDPEVATGYRPGNQFVCRGVTPWRDEVAAEGAACATRIFMGTVDARVIALDARTGEACSGFGEKG